MLWALLHMLDTRPKHIMIAKSCFPNLSQSPALSNDIYLPPHITEILYFLLSTVHIP